MGRIIKDELYRATQRWTACWRELQALESGRTVRADSDRRIAALRAEIAELQPARDAYVSRTYFGGRPAPTIGVGGIGEGIAAARRVNGE